MSASKQRPSGFIPKRPLNAQNFLEAYVGKCGHTSRHVEAPDDGSVNAATNSPCCRPGRRRRARHFLVADDSGGGCCDFAAGLSAEPRQRCDNIQCRRMFLLPRRAQPARSTRLGGGLAIPSPFGTFYAPNISPDPNDGIGRWTEADFVTAVTQGNLAERRALFSGVSLHLLPACEARGRPRSLCLSEDACAGARQGARSRRAVSVQHPPQRRHLEMAVHGRQAVRSGRGEIAAMESRRLSRQQSRPLRGVSQPAQFPRRHHQRAAICRRAQSGRRGLGSQHHAKGAWRSGARRISPISSRPARCPTATAPADRWCA